MASSKKSSAVVSEAVAPVVNPLISVFNKITCLFDSLPTGLKIIVYAGTTLMLTQVAKDAEAFKVTLSNPYATILFGIGINLIQWVIVEVGVRAKQI